MRVERRSDTCCTPWADRFADACDEHTSTFTSGIGGRDFAHDRGFRGRDRMFQARPGRAWAWGMRDMHGWHAKVRLKTAPNLGRFAAVELRLAQKAGTGKASPG